MSPLPTTLAIIELSFDPTLVVLGLAVRLETLVLAAVILGALVVARLLAARDRPAPGAEPLRSGDLLFLLLAALPGAVAGGRVGYAILHLDFYAADPGALLDPGKGALQLSLGVVGGAATAVLFAALVGMPVGRWLRVAILPLLIGVVGGKAAMLLGGSGQGEPSSLAWATSYVSRGPWGSLAPAMASHPAQAYEAVVSAGVALAIVGLLASGAVRRGATAFLAGLGLWALARAFVASTWRDPAVLGPLRADQLVSLAVAVGCASLAGARTLRARRRESGDRPADGQAVVVRRTGE